MSKKIILSLITIALLLFAGCNNTNIEKNKENKTIGLANPASEYCIKNGGKLEIKKDTDGNKYGICKFETFQCEEWAYMNGECDSKTQISNFDKCKNENGTIFGISQNQCELNEKIYIKNSDKTISLENCGSYFDGCNTCFINKGKIGGCTLMYCDKSLQKEPACKLELQTRIGKIIKIQNSTIDLVFDDIAEKFKYNGNIENLKEGQEVKIQIDNIGYGKNTIYNIELYQEQPKICTREYAPVCGINNKTYSNSCMAGDIQIKHKGKC